MRKSTITVMSLLTMAVLTPGTGWTEPLKFAREKVLAISGDIVKSEVTISASESTVAVKNVPQPGARSMRLHFQLGSAPGNASWTIKVFDTTGKQAWTYSPPETGRRAAEWSDDIKGDSARVEVHSTAKNQPFKLTIDRIDLHHPRVAPKSITLPDQREKIGIQSAATRSQGKAVARLRFIGDDENSYVCSGFLISPDLFMTNHHCPQSDSEWRSALVDFDYDVSSAKPKTLRFREKLISDQAFDFAIFRLASPLTDRQPLPWKVEAPGENAALLVIEHPGGEPKQVSKLDCRVAGAAMEGMSEQKTDFGHECDTLGGSSGSPVLDFTSRRVVGLHHLGFTSTSEKLVNRAVKIGGILDFIRTKQPSLAEELAPVLVH